MMEASLSSGPCGPTQTELRAGSDSGGGGEGREEDQAAVPLLPGTLP